jgi:hypothetical protein
VSGLSRAGAIELSLFWSPIYAYRPTEADMDQSASQASATSLKKSALKDFLAAVDKICKVITTVYCS